MTATVTNSRSGSAAPAPRRKRSVRIIAATAVVGIASTAIVAAGGGTAGAATLPQAQSVGNFLDATVGGNTLDAIAKLQYATAKSPGTQSVQNPLDATVLNALELPLTDAIQLPEIAGIKLGAVNQVAVAKSNGLSYGASGAVSNSGGIAVGGDDNAFPSSATIDLCAAALTGGNCGANESPLDALGSLSASIGAVAALAQTPKGYGKPGTTDYGIAGLNLTLGSPLLGGLLGTATTTISGLLTQVTTAIAPLKTLLTTLGFPTTGCALTDGTLPTTISLDSNGVKGIVSIDVATATINISLDKLLQSLELDLNNLPANTDLVKYIVDNLSGIISDGVGGLVNGLITTLGDLVGTCVSGATGAGLAELITALTGTITTVTGTLGDILKPITDAIAPVLDLLTNVIDIGVNVQPNGPDGTYTTALDATPKQDTPIVKNQTIVRAIEIDLLNTGGLPDLVPNSARQHKLTGNGAHSAKLATTTLAANSGVTLALANAAAGPSTAPAVAPPTSSEPASPTSSVPNSALPTGVPAGAAGHDGSPVLPLVLLLLALTLAGGGVVSYRLRGKFSR